MSLTAQKITLRFHVDYDIEFEDRFGPGDALQTELLDVITTESLETITVEDIETKAEVLRAQKIRHNTFIATNKRITGA